MISASLWLLVVELHAQTAQLVNYGLHHCTSSVTFKLAVSQCLITVLCKIPHFFLFCFQVDLSNSSPGILRVFQSFSLTVWPSLLIFCPVQLSHMTDNLTKNNFNCL